MGEHAVESIEDNDKEREAKELSIYDSEESMQSDAGISALYNLVEAVTLIYHEARNVRHLINAGAIKEESWKYLRNLPKNRYKDWVIIQGVRKAAHAEKTVLAALERFRTHFHVDLAQLKELYSNPSWRNSYYGGNAWLKITGIAQQLANCLEQDYESELIAEFEKKLLAARHNTGTLAEKIRHLDEWLLSEKIPS